MMGMIVMSVVITKTKMRACSLIPMHLMQIRAFVLTQMTVDGRIPPCTSQVVLDSFTEDSQMLLICYSITKRNLQQANQNISATLVFTPITITSVATSTTIMVFLSLPQDFEPLPTNYLVRQLKRILVHRNRETGREALPFLSFCSLAFFYFFQVTLA
jgi:hypothetical protein